MRRLYILLLAIVAVAAVLVAVFHREREPEYGGKRLSEWVELLHYNEPARNAGQRQAREDALDAIRHIGTDAVPSLLEWMRYETPAWKLKLMEATLKLPDGVRPRWKNEIRRDMRAFGAALAFQVFGSEAKGAITELSRMVTNRTDRAIRAAAALRYFGNAGLAPLLPALTNQNVRVMNNAFGSLIYMSTDSLPAVPALVQYLQHANPKISLTAAFSLGELKLEPDLVIPALVNSLQNSSPYVRESAAVALAKFGKPACVAVPALLSLLKDTEPRVRTAVANTLLIIDPQALERAAH